MRLILPSYRIEDPDGLTPGNVEILRKRVERHARTSYLSEGAIKEGSAEELTRKLGVNGRCHFSVFRAAHVAVRYVVDRGVSHELVRHHVGFDICQESTRYCNYSKDKFGNHVTSIIPPRLRSLLHPGIYTYDASNETYPVTVAQPVIRGNILISGTLLDSVPGARAWIAAEAEAEKSYMNLLNTGWSPQEARCALTHSTKTEISAVGNLEAWRNVMKARNVTGVHPDMREVMQPLTAEFCRALPEVYGDLV